MHPLGLGALGSFEVTGLESSEDARGDALKGPEPLVLKQVEAGVLGPRGEKVGEGGGRRGKVGEGGGRKGGPGGRGVLEKAASAKESQRAS